MAPRRRGDVLIGGEKKDVDPKIPIEGDDFILRLQLMALFQLEVCDMGPSLCTSPCPGLGKGCLVFFQLGCKGKHFSPSQMGN